MKTLSRNARGLRLGFFAAAVVIVATPMAFAEMVSSVTASYESPSACSSAGAQGATGSNPAPTQAGAVAAAPDVNGARVEPILGYTPDANGISFQVTSGGCTQATDFKTQLERNGANTVKLTLLRLQPDTCRSFVPTGKRVYLTYAEMGLNPAVPFVLSNPNGMVSSFVWGQN